MENYKYEVTIGMPVYGVEKYIRKCMLSVLNQTFKEDIEILAVDDHGPDNSIEIIKELQATHPRGNNIRIITQPKNMGCWAARNKVIEEAQGKYLFLLDSDDYISEDCIEKLYAEAIKHNAEAVYGSVMPVDEMGNPKDIGQDYLNQPYKVFHKKDGLASVANQRLHPTFRDYIWNTLIKHDFIEKNHIRFKQAKFCDDIICSADMTPLITDAVLIPDHTYFYVIRENSLSNYQYRKIIKLEEIKEMILMFYAVCGALKNRDRIQPALSNSVIKSAMEHPFSFGEILKFKKYRIINLSFFMLNKLPASVFVSILKYIGKKKKYIN